MQQYQEKFFKTSAGNKIQYFDNENKPAKPLLIFFSPGFQNGQFIVRFDPRNDLKEFHNISITYPSRDNSEVIEDNSVINLVVMLFELIQKIQKANPKKQIYLVGFSFGTMLITKMLQLHQTELAEMQIILVSPGEFIPTLRNYFLQIVLFPTRFYFSYIRFVRWIFCRVLGIFQKYQFPDERLEALNQQLLAALRYKIDRTILISNKTLIIVADRDQAIKRKSLVKIKEVFPKHYIRSYSGKHLIKYPADPNIAVVREMVRTEIRNMESGSWK
ncbi:MAG: hypothetical protein WCJ58_02055 [bacterium]